MALGGSELDINIPDTLLSEHDTAILFGQYSFPDQTDQSRFELMLLIVCPVGHAGIPKMLQVEYMVFTDALLPEIVEYCATYNVFV